MAKKDQAELIGYLVKNGWEDDGQTHSERYRLITKASYPLAGAEVTTGGKPRFRKGDWKIGVGSNTTVIYRKPENPERVATHRGKVFTFQDWDMYSFNTRDQDQIKAKLEVIDGKEQGRLDLATELS